jgi:hypothetical protein
VRLNVDELTAIIVILVGISIIRARIEADFVLLTARTRAKVIFTVASAVLAQANSILYGRAVTLGSAYVFYHTALNANSAVIYAFGTGLGAACKSCKINVFTV